MQIDALKKLLLRRENGETTEEENLLLDKWYEDIYRGELMPDEPINYNEDEKEIWERIQRLKERGSIKSPIVRKLFPRKALHIAAGILVLFAIGGSAYWIQQKLHSRGQSLKLTQDIAPASNQAILTLSDGKKITLDDSSRGAIAQAQGITIKKTDQGKIIYSKSDEKLSSGAPEEMNVITTPKGGQYEITLQDGTQVWLNAGSKLTFPVTFAGRGKREVTLTGEAYFEVAKDSHKPFSVHCTDQLVTVTGTHFDVSCYPFEPLQTTLAEGSVIVSQPKTGKQQNLSPGEQSTVTISEGIQVKKVNPADYTAWKDDQFVFVQTPMEQVFSQIGRWYNVDIDYSGVNTDNFDGRISRRIPLSQIIHALESSTDLKFKVVGRRIMVTQ
jgi:transmembrane sensor